MDSPYTVDEDREQRQEQHLDEDKESRSPLFPSMELVVEGSVQPGDPGETEENGELADTPPTDVTCQVVSSSPDNDHVDEVVEQLEETDRAVFYHLTVGTRRKPKATARIHGRYTG